ncbi:AlpA family phage regulatory protein [Bradyrhizobium sp. 76]|uniref:helix-turn-helix transcriptional regulator n=1 Tax=Bradyrhizobium sp. 76 TaxID=2782680 RepID=UPI001FF78269|nr:AlpA family phage regulatory protein [Bradyrhizobium sp. 76]MCK1407111.1 AlpA family phage regulatory protein [Bradyrhizobium sp. 76]
MIVVQRQQTNEAGPRRMLNEARVLEIIPISRTTLYRMEKTGRFPKCTYISPNRRVWYEDEIVAWQDEVNAFDPSRGRGKGRRGRGIAGVADKPGSR